MNKTKLDSQRKSTPNKKRAMIEALERSLGVVTTACKVVGIDRSTHYGWVKDDEDYKKAVEDTDNVVLDFAESQLHKQIKSGNATSTIFFLKTRGKKRGYIEGIDVTSGGDKINGTPMMVTLEDAKKVLADLDAEI